MGTIISVLNKAGETFCQHGMTMLVQFGILTSLLFLADILIRKRVKASLRYCLWSLVLVKLVLPTTLSLPTGIGHLTGVNFSFQLTQNPPKPQIQTAYAPTTSMPAQTSSGFARSINSPQDIAESSILKASGSPASVETIPLNWQGGIFIAWLFGVIVLLAGFLRRIASIKKLIAQSEPAPERLVEMVHSCQERIGVNGIVELRLSNNMVSPAVCGLLRHVIIVPTGLLENMDRSKLAMVLMHELSHVKRADLWVNMFQTILQIFYFYNPFVWAANAYVRRVREQAVDEMVLTHLNGEVTSYSNTLIDVAEKAFSQPQFRLATVSIIESKGKLKERIKIMLSKPIPKDTKIGFAGLVLIIAVAAVLLPMAKAKDGGAVDNHSTVTVKESAGIDVGVEDFNISPYPEGGLYTVTVSIRNRGSTESPKFGVNFYRGDPNNLKPMTHGAGPIKPGDVWKEGSMPFALKEGTNEIAVLLDPDNAIGEPNRTNNKASMTVIVKDGKIVEKKVSLSSAKGVSKETTGLSDQVINAAEFGDTNGTNAGKDNRMSTPEKTGAESTAGRIDLLEQYPTTLTGANTNPQDAREWQFTPQDIYSISRFSFDVNNALQVKIDSADIGIGHCKDGSVWAVVIPREHGTIKSLTFGEELIDHLWLRFHPREVLSLFPKDTIIAGGDKNLWGRMNEIARVKMNSSWHAGGRAMIPAPKDFTVDADTKKNVRRFFMVDREAKTAEYVSFFEGRTVPAQTSSSPPVVVRTTPAAFANDISADLNQLTVTFSQQMKDKSWAWVQLDAPYPETTGKPYYDEEKKTCTLPVKLEPGKAYLVAFNVEPYIGFLNSEGKPAKPYVLVFATKDKDGKPAPIPEDLITKAKSINDSAQKASSVPEKEGSETESAPYTQAVYDEIGPDGTITFKNTIRQINRSGRTITSNNFINSDFVQVTAMKDADGNDLKFTSVHDGDIYRYEVTFNKPIPPGALIEYTSEGTMKGLIKPVAGSEKTFQYYMRHSPAAGEPTQRIETYLLPAGAELISTTPEDMERRTKDGRIELNVEKMIPIGGSITTSFRYRLGTGEGSLPNGDNATQSKGEQIIKKMAEVNRYWLIESPSQTKNYSYEFSLYKGETETFKVAEPSSSDRTIRQGITYDSLLHKLAKEPFAATYTSIEEVNGIIRTDFKLKEPIQIHAGNGLKGRWYGSFDQLVEGGTFWIDAKKMSPVRAKCDDVYEYFSDYAAVDEAHYVPLRVKIDKNDMHFDWTFKLHKPGLWLFDQSRYVYDKKGQEPIIAASTSNVRINGELSEQSPAGTRDTNKP